MAERSCQLRRHTHLLQAHVGSSTYSLAIIIETASIARSCNWQALPSLLLGVDVPAVKLSKLPGLMTCTDSRDQQ